MDAPLRCPHCNALVVDRRFPSCTTCNLALPAEWVMSRDQVAKLTVIDNQCKAQYVESMRTLDPSLDPNVPALVKLLDSNASMLGI